MSTNDQNPKHPFNLLCWCDACQVERDALHAQQALLQDESPDYAADDLKERARANRRRRWRR